jgi:hypothetical protein
MRQHLTFAVISSALAGCSLIYSPNNLPPGVIDAPSDAEIVLDADPKMLAIDDVQPSTIYEGQGDFGSQPAVIVIHGHHIIDNNTIVEITPTTGTVQLALGAPVIAGDGDWIAIQVTAHVDPLLMPGAQVALDVKVTESIPAALGGGTASSMLSNKLALMGLKELTKDTAPEVDKANSKIDTTLLADRYSKVDLSGISTATFIGAKRAVIVSMSSITTSALVATGASGEVAAGSGGAAVGGCAGGAPGSTGGCDNLVGGKGGAGDAVLGGSGGGGGGGFATEGMSGQGSIAGVAGSRTGDELITSYSGDSGRSPSRAGGGGGGGKPMLIGGPGGIGGAGGGSIELTAGGDVSVGAITANGGPGGDGSTASGGGGGAGGLVMLRADGSLTTSGTISVKGGPGGAGKGTNNGNGGAGSDGRVRWDVPAGGAPTVPFGTRHRGPAFTLPTRIFRSGRATISLSGTSNDQFTVYTVHDGTLTPGQDGAFADSTATFTQILPQGLTHLCITLRGGQQGTPEADKCVDVAFIP